MYIKEIDNTIIDRLKAKVKDFQIESCPTSEDKFAFTHPKGAILIRYNGSSFSQPYATDLMVQDEVIEFDIFLGLRYLMNFQEAYSSLMSVIKILTGYQPQGCSKIQPVRSEFLNEDNGDLWYGLTISLIRTSIESIEEEDPVLLKKITIENNFNDVEVIEKDEV